jgi:hypothetical protein
MQRQLYHVAKQSNLAKERISSMTNDSKPKMRKGRNAHHQRLIDLKVEGRDLDQIADYFALVFEYDTEEMTVLVALLDRLVAVEKSEEVHLEDIVHFLSRRLFARCAEGEKTADRFLHLAPSRASRFLESAVG